MIEYGSPTPPEYLLSMVSCPVVLYWADNDWLAHPTDVALLADNLPNLVASYKVPFNTFNHLDFLWGKTADSLLYKPALPQLPANWLIILIAGLYRRLSAVLP